MINKWLCSWGFNNKKERKSKEKKQDNSESTRRFNSTL